MRITVFLSRFGAFLTSLYTFAQQLVQPPQLFVICAHPSSSFSFLPTNCKCFWYASIAFIQLTAVL